MKNQNIYNGENIINNNMLPGNPKGLPDESFSYILNYTLVFIDSNFLSKLSSYFGIGKYLIYDIVTFSENIAKKQKLIRKEIYYYTAPPFQSPIPTESEERKRDGYDRFLNKLKAKNVVIREGRCQRLKIDGIFEYKQKGVDILLAMDLMSIPIKFPNIKKIILIASDSDFVPVIMNLAEQKIKTILYTYYKKRRGTNGKLMKEEFSKPPFNEKASKKAILNSLNFYNKNGEIYLIENSNEVIGIIVFQIEQWWEGKVLVIQDLAIKKKFQKRWMQDLMKFIDQYAINKKIKRIYFETNKKSHAIKLYKKLGYKINKDRISMTKKIK